ncbi:MAG TPA: histidine kinase dimerization/phosphoacceptor domain -containing protein [Hymenobacter sp.]
MKLYSLLWAWALGGSLLVVPTAPTPPGARAQAHALLTAGRAAQTTDTAASRRAAQRAYALACAAGLDTLATRARVEIGVSGVRDAARFGWALAHLRAARTNAQALGLSSEVARTYCGEGLAEQTRRQFARALAAFQTELTLWKRLGDAQGLVEAYNDIGLVHRSTGQYPEAMQAHLQSLGVAESAGNVRGQITALRNLGSLSRVLNDQPAMLAYTTRALALLRAQPRPDSVALVSVHASLALMLLDQKHYGRARPHLLAGLRLARRLNSTKTRLDQGYLEYGLGEVANVRGDHHTARLHYWRATALFRQLRYPEQQASALNSLAKVQLLLGQTPAALQSAQQALALSRQFTSANSLANAYAEYADFSARRRDFATAYPYQLRSQQLRDSIFTVEKAQQLAELRTRYEAEQKEAQLRRLRGTAVRQQTEAKWERRYRNLLAGALLVVGLLGGASYRRYRMQRRTSRQLRQAQLQQKARNAELEQVQRRLRQSLNDKEVLLKEVHHRVKNNLQIIASLLALQAQAQAQLPAVVAALREGQNWIKSIAMAHELLYQTDDLAHVNFQHFAEQLTAHLQRAFAIPAVRVQVQAADILLGTNTVVPLGLIVNELLSNAFKYAYAGGRAGTVAVILHADAVTGNYRLTVADDGPGLPPGFVLAKASSLGLRLVKSLARQLNGELMLPPPDGKGAKFVVTFPAEADFPPQSESAA